MARPVLFGIVVAVFTAVLLVSTLLYQAWAHEHAVRRARAARRLGVAAAGPVASLDRPPERGIARWLRARLDQAGDPRSVAQLAIQIALLATAGLLVSVLLVHGPTRLLGLLPGAIPLLLLRRQATARRRKMTEQLPDAFDRIGRTLRAGHAFSDALRLASEEMASPIAEELARVAATHALGVDLRACLEALSARNPDNFDIRLFVGAVLLHRETGGNLVEILAHLAETVRERLIFDGKVLSLTAEVRLSAAILGFLPFFVSGVLLLVQPAYLAPLVTTALGRSMLVVGAGSLLVGALVMRRLAAVEA